MAVPSRIILYQKNDQFIEIDGLKDGLAGTFVNNATVTATLKDRSGVVVSEVNNLTLVYVAASNGKYRGLVEDTFNPTRGGGYTLVVEADQAGTKLHLEIPVEVRVRKS